MEAAWIGLTGVFVGALMTAAKEWVFKYLGDKRKARYLAIRVCTRLDKFFFECADVVNDDGLVEGQMDPKHGRMPQVDLADIQLQDLDVDWQVMSSKLAYGILSLPNDVEMAKRNIAGWADHAFPPDYEEVFVARQVKYAQLGLKASQLAADLRKFAKLPLVQRGEWDPEVDMKARLEDEKKASESRKLPMPW